MSDHVAILAVKVTELEKTSAALKIALATLQANPTEPDANLVVGKYYCFVEDNWDMGLRSLALGSDPALKELAARELKDLTDVEAKVALGDGWWDLAEKVDGNEKEKMRLRAARWYRQVPTGLTGLTKDRIEKRLKEVPVARGETSLAGRMSPDARGELCRKYGGSAGSEAAVAAALKWLAMHQCRDGGWCFDLRNAPGCQGKCRNSGELAKARCAATGLALLPFLGAGQTHKEGKYKTAVNNGLNFLCTRMEVSPQGASMWENGGSMYAHGIASIAVCEAYAMTHDRRLHKPAQGAINFICYAQDPVGGGWRYSPREKGDTSVFGWQIMALKSGHMGNLRVPPEVLQKAFGYLDTVQADSGAQYGYTAPGTGAATTAIGLLCRMYLGWKKDNPALERGVQHIGAMGPQTGNMYYNYYASQVLFHWQGDVWKKWNGVMQDQLVNSQGEEGCEKGSWYMGGGDHGATKGGRLYCTAMSAMILEVYYRYPPVYEETESGTSR